MLHNNPTNRYIPTSPNEILDVITFYTQSIAQQTTSEHTLLTLAMLLHAVKEFEKDRMHDYLLNKTDRANHVLNAANLFHRRFDRKLHNRPYASEAIFLNVAIAAYELGVIADINNIELDVLKQKALSVIHGEVEIIDSDDIDWVDSPLLLEDFDAEPDSETEIEYERLPNSPASPCFFASIEDARRDRNVYDAEESEEQEISLSYSDHEGNDHSHYDNSISYSDEVDDARFASESDTDSGSEFYQRAPSRRR